MLKRPFSAFATLPFVSALPSPNRIGFLHIDNDVQFNTLTVFNACLESCHIQTAGCSGHLQMLPGRLTARQDDWMRSLLAFTQMSLIRFKPARARFHASAALQRVPGIEIPENKNCLAPVRLWATWRG